MSKINPLSSESQAENPTFSTCINLSLRKATRSLTQFYDTILRPSGLRSTQFTILRALEVLGPVSIMELAERLAMDRTTLSRNLRPLEQQALLTITPGDDRRARFVELTDQGRDRLQQAIPLWEDAQTRTVRGLGAQRVQALLGELEDVLEVVRQR